MDDTQTTLKSDIKRLLVEILKLNDTNPDDILDAPSLFTGENTITLDSIDAIELIMAVQRKYSVRIDDQNLARNIVNSVDNIAEFILSEQSKSQN